MKFNNVKLLESNILWLCWKSFKFMRFLKTETTARKCNMQNNNKKITLKVQKYNKNNGVLVSRNTVVWILFLILKDILSLRVTCLPSRYYFDIEYDTNSHSFRSLNVMHGRVFLWRANLQNIKNKEPNSFTTVQNKTGKRQ